MESYFSDKTAFLYNVLFSNQDKEAYAYQNHQNKSFILSEQSTFLHSKKQHKYFKSI